ncbi:MAG: 50S ribosomal protein L23 [Candidatus Poribacteria bacterium]|nr:50S ribosomal protein L23 [Candidatus Poribacteria bacterium]MDE0482086.1 50S ribosomal protein L23 [Candidatus Poribacteria bacterium]
MKDKYKVILRPHITEKSTLLREDNKYSFVVSRDATKTDIRRAAEELFEIQGSIINIHTMQMRGKMKGRMNRYQRGRRPHWKKAIITVEEGTRIPVFESI